MTTQQRLSVLFKLTILFTVLLTTACKTLIELHTQLSEQDANQVVAVLVDNGIYSEKQQLKEGFCVLIEKHDMAQAVNVLSARGIPKRHQTNLGEIFKKEGVISTPLEERARYIYALSQELEFTLSKMDGVVTTRVHVVLPERIAPGEPVNPSSAAVFIKHEMTFDPDIYTSRVRHLVASSIPGLSNKSQTDKIAIIYSPAQLVTSAIDWKMLGPYKVDSATAVLLKQTFYALLLLPLLFLTMFILIPNATIREKLFGLLKRYQPHKKPPIKVQ